MFAFRYNDQLSALRSDLRSCKRKTALQQKQIAEQQKQIAEQQKQTLEYANRLDDYDKKNEETSRKFQTLLQVITYYVVISDPYLGMFYISNENCRVILGYIRLIRN